MTPFFRIWPYGNAALKRLRGIRRMPEAAHQTEELAPSVQQWMPPLIALGGQKEKVSATIARHSLTDHLRYFDGFTADHAAVIKYRIGPAYVFPNGCSTRGMTFNRWGPIDHKNLLTAPVVRFSKASYCLEDRSYLFFGHWIRSFAQALLADPAIPILHNAPEGWGHARGYEALFELPSPAGTHFLVDDLTVFQDYGQGPHKAARYHELRRRLQANFTESPTGRRVYLRRGNSGARRAIMNEDALITALLPLGFQVVDVTTATAEELVAQLVGAEIAITIEGSHADHLHFAMKEGGLLLILNPSDHFNTSQFAVAHALGNRAATVILDRDTATGDYSVKIDDVHRTLDMAQNAPQTGPQ